MGKSLSSASILLILVPCLVSCSSCSEDVQAIDGESREDRGLVDDGGEDGGLDAEDARDGALPDVGHLDQDVGPVVLDLGLHPDGDAAAADVAPDAAERDAGPCPRDVPPGCSTTLTSTECQAHGGIWVPAEIGYCGCPARDFGCRCTGSDQCEGDCLSDAFGPQCPLVTEGYCSELVVVFWCACVLGPAEAIDAGSARERCP